jgi:hypothetical protein
MEELEMRTMAFKNSVGAVLQTLLEELAASGAISAQKYSERLTEMSKDMEEDLRDNGGVWDVGLIRNLAQLLKPDYPSSIVENPEPPEPDNENP